MNKESRSEFVKREVAVAVIGLLVTGIAGAVFREEVWSFIKAAWDWLWEPVEVTRWWFGVLLLTFIAVAGYVLLKIVRPPVAQRPEYEKYTEDLFQGIPWRWSWLNGKPHRLTPFCPTCDRVMVYSVAEGDLSGLVPTKTRLRCEACNVPYWMDGDWDHVQNRIIRETWHRVRTGVWRRASSE